MKRRVLIPILLALLLAAALAPAAFGAPSSDTIIEENEVVDNDVVVLDGDLEVQRGAVVNGDVAVFNGDARIDGQVDGSITLFNGDLEAGPEAAISGECVLLNGDVTVQEGRRRTLGNCTAIQSLKLAPLAELAQVDACPDFASAAPKVRESMMWLAQADARAVHHDVVRMLSCPRARAIGGPQASGPGAGPGPYTSKTASTRFSALAAMSSETGVLLLPSARMRLVRCKRRKMLKLPPMRTRR